ncbi:MAG: nucleotidyltransferase [Vulcanibacillus sp.]
MSTLGVVVEYNPFHNGHLHHIQQAKKVTNTDTVVAIMSGSFLQRGEPALINKWVRTKMALTQGVDLIIELPTVYATQSADLFAYGSTFLLHHLKVENLVFGSELGSLEVLNKISDLLLDEPLLLKKYIKDNLSQGYSYPKALSLALNNFNNQAEDRIFKPNDILGIQYLYSLKKINSSIRVNTIKRISANYHDKELNTNNIASATAIRNSIFTKNQLDEVSSVVPNSTFSLLEEEYAQNRFNSWNNYFQTLQIIINSQDNKDLLNIHGMVEGLENRIKNNINNAKSFEEFTNLIMTKRYTLPKIQRTLLYLLLNLTKTKIQSFEIDKGPQYIRVLGFNEKGKAYLNSIKHNIELPLITKITREKSPMLELDINSSKIYELGLGNAFAFDEYKRTPVYFK